MNSQTKNTILLLTIGTFFAFFVFGFTDNLKGPVLPALLLDLKFNYSLGGTILLGAYLGFMAATMTTGFLADVAGQKTVLVLAGVSLAVGISGFSTLTAPFWLTISMAFLGFGLGSLELGCNSLIVKLHSTDKGRYLNLMAVLHGMGSMLAPLYAGWLLMQNVSWRSVYRWDLVLVGLLIIYFTIIRFPKVDTEKTEKLDLKKVGKKAFTPKMLWFYIAITVYVSFELGLASWMVEFLQKERSFTIPQSTQALSAFFGLIMLGRFVGSFFVERLGYLKFILGASLCASAFVILGLYGPAQFSVFLPASGFFLSVIFPNITASVSDENKENLNTILGLLFTFAGLGGVLGPWLVGIASDIGGLKFGFSLNFLFGLLTAFSAFILIKISNKKAKVK